jgi:uncharacterized protein
MATAFTVPPIAALKSAAAEVARRNSLDLVVLFGSAARAGGVAPHDLDIGVLGRGLTDALAATNAFIELLRIQPVDIVDLRRADPVLLIQVARDGIPLFERTPTQFAEFVSLAARRFADTKKFRDAEEAYIEEFLATRRDTL